MTRNPLLLLALVAVSGWGVGCQRAPVSLPPFGVSQDYQVLQGQPGPGLVANPNSPIPDVPKPIGFKPLVGLSSASSDGVARTVRHVYQGVGSSADAVNFYHRALPLNHWRFVSQRTIPEGGTLIVYNKGNEDLHIATQQGFGGVSTITIDIVPRGTAPGPLPSAEAAANRR
jgi:hypothetical protein